MVETLLRITSWGWLWPSGLQKLFSTFKLSNPSKATLSTTIFQDSFYWNIDKALCACDMPYLVCHICVWTSWCEARQAPQYLWGPLAQSSITSLSWQHFEGISTNNIPDPPKTCHRKMLRTHKRHQKATFGYQIFNLHHNETTKLNLIWRAMRFWFVWLIKYTSILSKIWSPQRFVGSSLDQRETGNKLASLSL